MRSKCAEPKPEAAPPPLWGYEIHANHRACRRAAGPPFSAKRGRRRVAADGVCKAATHRCRFVVTAVQSDSGRSSGPHPIRRHSPSNDGRLSTRYGVQPDRSLTHRTGYMADSFGHLRSRLLLLLSLLWTLWATRSVVHKSPGPPGLFQLSP